MMPSPEQWLILAVIPKLGMSYHFCFSGGKAETESNVEISKIMTVSSGHMCLSRGNEKQTREFEATCVM